MARNRSRASEGVFSRRTRRQRQRSRSLRLENLETRDLLATVTMSASNSVEEGGSPSYFTATRDDTSGNLTVNYSIGGTATNGSDYTTLTGSVVIPNGQTSAQIALTPSDDSAIEGTETLILTVTSGTYSIGSPAAATLSIADADAATISVFGSAPYISEDGSEANFSISRDGDATGTLQVSYAFDTVYGNANIDSDFTASPSSSIAFPAGVSTVYVSIESVPDYEIEDDEDILLAITSGTGYTASEYYGSAAINITDDDQEAVVSVSASTTSPHEEDLEAVVFTFHRDYGNPTEPLQVMFSVAGSTATEGIDYYWRSPHLSVYGGSIYFPANETDVTLTLMTVDDYADETNETVDFSIGSGSYGTTGTTSYPVTITDNESFGASHDISNTKSGPCCYALPVGAAHIDRATGLLSAAGGLTALEGKLAYNQAWGARPIIAQDVTFTSPATSATSIEVQLTFGGLSQSSVYYDPASITLDEPMRIAIEVDASSLASGHYAWSMAVIEHYSGSGDVTQNLSGVQDIRKNYSAAYGALWAPVYVDRLIVSGSGALWEEGRGNSYWFPVYSGVYSRSPGEPGFSTLVYSGGSSTYTLTSKHGDARVFDSSGRLTKRIDQFGNETTYTYTDGDGDSTSDEVATITDPAGRVTTYAYSSNKLASITDLADRVTTFTITSGKLMSVTSPDPDGGGLSAPVMSFAYDGGTGLLTTITNAESEATAITYHADRTVDEIEYPDESTEQYNVPLRAALVIPGASWGSSGNPADLVETAGVIGETIDRAGESWT